MSTLPVTLENSNPFQINKSCYQYISTNHLDDIHNSLSSRAAETGMAEAAVAMEALSLRRELLWPPSFMACPVAEHWYSLQQRR